MQTKLRVHTSLYSPSFFLGFGMGKYNEIYKIFNKIYCTNTMSIKS
jgi:hypothetical protein